MLCSSTKKEQGNKPPQRLASATRVETLRVCFCCIWLKVTAFSKKFHRGELYDMPPKRTPIEIDLNWVFDLILGAASVVIPWSTEISIPS
jgi:hypothetical protein